MILLNGNTLTKDSSKLLRDDLSGYSLSLVIHKKEDIYNGICLNKSEIERNYSFADEAACIHLVLLERANIDRRWNGDYVAVPKNESSKWGIITISDHYESDQDYDCNVYFQIFGFTSLGLKLLENDYTIYLNSELNKLEQSIRLECLKRQNSSHYYFVKNEFIQKQFELDEKKRLIETKLDILSDLLKNPKNGNKAELILMSVELKSKLMNIANSTEENCQHVSTEELRNYANELIQLHMQSNANKNLDR